MAGEGTAVAKAGKAGKDRPSLSVGSPTSGRLERGVRLRAARKKLALKNPRGAVWGLPQLVKMLERGARKVSKRYPGSVLLVGDLSKRGGGRLGGHRSHTSGRDADVGFYFVDKKGEPVATKRFRRVQWDGKAVDAKHLTFDDARNWALVQAWVTDPQARVQHIFVAKPLRQRLLQYARKRGVYLPVLHRAAVAMKQPTRGLVHDDHFHLRIRCPRSQRDVCVSEPSRGGAPKKPRAPKRKGGSAGVAAVSGQPSAVSRQRSAVSRQRSAVSRQPSGLGSG